MNYNLHRGDMMKSDKNAMVLYLDDELFQKVDDYRFKNRFSSRNAAIRKLIEIGLAHVEKEETT
jgi:metal-responsive CopG/Arc/MetJ family transcriptional regulator